MGCREVHEVWGPALNLEVTMSADGLDVDERERGLVSDPKTFGRSSSVRGTRGAEHGWGESELELH